MIYLKIILSFEIILIFLKKQKLNQKNKTPLHYAAEKDSKEIGQVLISKDVDINTKDIIYLNIKILFLSNLILNK